ncbi:MAG: hypothetical protein PHX05_07295 [Acidobacteriota bacterium]|nr:hypothetical protein [Acidobacteriota bacterium]
MLTSDSQQDAEYAEEHLHHKVRWFGKLNPQDATHWAVTIDGHLAQPFRAISGNGVYGADPGDEAQCFGTADIPITGMKWGDFDEILIVANSSNTLYLGRLVWGTGTLAASIGLGQYSEFVFFRPAADNNRKVFVATCEKIPIEIAGLPVKIWVQCQNATDNATIDFIIGVHGYNF